jgi:hypothetical protein
MQYLVEVMIEINVNVSPDSDIEDKITKRERGGG